MNMYFERIDWKECRPYLKRAGSLNKPVTTYLEQDLQVLNTSNKSKIKKLEK